MSRLRHYKKPDRLVGMLYSFLALLFFAPLLAA